MSDARPLPSLRDELFERPVAFEFFQAVRLLHKVRAHRQPVGRDADPSEEVVRFAGDIALAFPPGDISEMRPGEAGEPDRMCIPFLGVASPASFGSLPSVYTEELRRQQRQHGNAAPREFLDLFNHRLTSLFYRAWERSRLPVLHELGIDHAFGKALFASFGLLGEAFAGSLPIEREALLSRAGLFAMSPAPAAAVEAAVESLFGVPARIEPFVPAWYPIEESDRCSLGAANASLGMDLNLGESVLLVQSRFRVRLGPMDRERFQTLLPGTAGFEALSCAVRLAAGVEHDFEIQLALRAEAVPATRLGGEEASRLGWTTWLRNEPCREDSDAAVFQPLWTHTRSGPDRAMEGTS